MFLRLEKELKEKYLNVVLKGRKENMKVEKRTLKKSIFLCLKISSVIFYCFPQNFRLRIEDPPRRKHMVFLGAAVLADIMKVREVKLTIK